MIEVGQIWRRSRAFTEEEVTAFVRLSGDVGRQHLERDGQGRLMVHGLLTATLPTQVGGELDFIASQMDYQFLRPVFVGDLIEAEVRADEVKVTERHTQMTVSVVCRNQLGKEVLKGVTRGVIPHSKGQP